MSTPPEPLTTRERDVLEFLAHHRADHGFAPSTKDVTDAFGARWRHKGSVREILRSLEAKGRIKRVGSARAAVVLGPNAQDDRALVAELRALAAHIAGPGAHACHPGPPFCRLTP